MPPRLFLEAGVITIADNEPGEDAFLGTLTPDSETGAYTGQYSGPLSGGELLSISAKGGSVSAIDAITQLPFAPLLLSHTVTTSSSSREVDIPISRTEDLELRLDLRDTAERLHVLLIKSPERELRFSCVFEGTSGQGLIPADALGQLPVGSRLHVISSHSESVETPQGRVQLLTAFEMTSPDKEFYPAFILE